MISHRYPHRKERKKKFIIPSRVLSFNAWLSWRKIQSCALIMSWLSNEYGTIEEKAERESRGNGLALADLIIKITNLWSFQSRRENKIWSKSTLIPLVINGIYESGNYVAASVDFGLRSHLIRSAVNHISSLFLANAVVSNKCAILRCLACFSTSDCSPAKRKTSPLVLRARTAAEAI